MKNDIETQGHLNIWEVCGEEEEVKIGHGVIELVGNKPQKRVVLYNEEKEVIGEAYVDSLQEDKGGHEKS